MISRIYVSPKKVSSRADSYLIDSKLSRHKIEQLAQALTNPILESFCIDKLSNIKDFSYAIEIGFLPGVTDNVGHTVKEIASDLLHLKTEIPKVVLKKRKPVINVDLEVSEEELIKIGKEGILDNGKEQKRRGPLALDLPSMQTIAEHFRKLKRDPTDIELESLAQTWSEHCKHTIFANPIDDIKDGLYKTYIQGATNLIRAKKQKKGRLAPSKGGDFCVSVFSDNAGGIIFDENYLIIHKVETHNSPSALDPFGGTITGIVGVNRDTIGFGLGAKPVANTYGFCFGNPNETKPLFRNKDLKNEMLLPVRIMQGVIKGINVGGNCSGIPTLSGFIKFHDR